MFGRFGNAQTSDESADLEVYFRTNIMAVIAQDLSNPSQYVTSAFDDDADDDDDDDNDDYERDHEHDHEVDDDGDGEYDVSISQHVIPHRYTATYDAGAIGTGLSLIGTHTSASNVFLNMTVSAL
jgi:ABC-type Zn2+ transport system substrate-binding protein/surface adhesin